jgi:integrase
MVDHTRSTPHSNAEIEPIIEAFLRDKGKGEAGESGNYRSDAERELGRFIEWLRTEELQPDGLDGRSNTEHNRDPASTPPPAPIPTFADVDERVFRRYARWLVKQGWSKGTTRTYYSYVSSFIGWAVDEGELDRHYAKTSLARAPLPDDDGRRSGDQQAWEPAQRDRLTRYVDEQATAAIDAADGTTPEAGSEYAAIRACRDRALVNVLAYTGVRAAEILRDPDDERRVGLLWDDLDLDVGSMNILRKTQQYDDASLPAPVVTALRIYKRAFSPPDAEWPVFPTLHFPTLARIVRDGLSAAGYSEDEIAAIRAESEYDFIVCREYGLAPPPAVTTAGARSRMKTLCAAAGIELDDKHGYLAPHGGRRGMGEVLVRKYGYAAAARYLDNSEEIVRESYSHIEAGEQADLATAALADSDQRVHDENAHPGEVADGGDSE